VASTALLLASPHKETPDSLLGIVFAMGASLRENEQKCSAAVGVEELKLLARSIRSAAMYYDEAFADAPDRSK